jgi:hypothetical protein
MNYQEAKRDLEGLRIKIYSKQAGNNFSRLYDKLRSSYLLYNDFFYFERKIE